METQTEIAVIKNQMQNIETKMCEGFKSLKEDNIRVEESMNKNIARLESSLTDFIKSSENKYANIWVEKAVSWTGYTIAGTVLVALLYLVVK